MYRYSVDNAVTYTPEDLELFRVSPFAAWMERLTLENPGHGIPPDVDGNPPISTMQRQDDVAQMLLSEGRQVSLVEWEHDESSRRAATLEAMREGADFIVNGQLALGPLAGACNLLMRTSGYSELGSYLYLPCDTQPGTTGYSTFRLCFLADLLHSLQGQLPPRLLIIRGGSDLLPLQSDDHIYYYRAVKHRFMQAMRAFRKHKMPDPAESAGFGRWSDCANEVLKQRALGEDSVPQDLVRELVGQGDESPGLRQAIAAVVDGSSAYDLDDTAGAVVPLSIGRQEARAEAGDTLAEQALQLVPGAYAAESGKRMPGPTPNLAWSLQHSGTEEDAAAERRQGVERRRAVSSEEPSPDRDDVSPQGVLHTLPLNEVPVERRQSSAPVPDAVHTGAVHSGAAPSPEAPPQQKPHPLDSAGFTGDPDSVVDLDSVAPALPAFTASNLKSEDSASPPSGEFSDRLITSEFRPD